MKKLLVALLSLGLIMVGGTATAWSSTNTNGQIPSAGTQEQTQSTLVQAVPAKQAESIAVAAEKGRERATEKSTWVCENPKTCPNNGACKNQEACQTGGIPKQDGTGYKGGADKTKGNGGNNGMCANAENCPNGGIPKQDGTGYQRGQGKNR